jgi:uncharacterized membrane protein YbhN (UPF0104 family)
MMGVAALIAAAAIAFVYHQFRRYSLDEVANSLAAIPPRHLAGAAFFVAMSYLTLTLFDTLGIRYVGRKVAWRRVAVASFCSLSIGHNVGFAALSTGALRLRFYSRMGLTVGDVARVILFCATTVGLGIIALACAVLLLATPPEGAGITPLKAKLVGAACFAVLVAYLAVTLLAKGPLRLGAWSVPVPPPRFALLQIAVGFANFAFVAAALWQALSGASGVGYVEVVVAYVIGVVAGLISHVPGGLGVLEAVVILVLPDAGVLGGLVLFRLLYYLVPLVLGLLALGFVELYEVRSRRRGGSFIGGGGSLAGGTGIGFGGSSIGGGASGSGGGTGGFVGG